MVQLSLSFNCYQLVDGIDQSNLVSLSDDLGEELDNCDSSNFLSEEIDKDILELYLTKINLINISVIFLNENDSLNYHPHLKLPDSPPEYAAS